MNAREKFTWSMRRELWEHRAFYIAPLVVAGLVLFAFLFNMGPYAGMMSSLTSIDPAKQVLAVVMPFSLAASVVLFTSFVVAMFYCLDALYTERRDRSILFWKSMPVSDSMTVLSKAAFPLAALPLIAFAIALVTQAALLVLASAVMVAKGIEPTVLWSRLPLGQMAVVMFYGLVVHTLWYAPIYGWLFLVSAWAKRAPFLWAVMPVFAAFVFEKVAFGTSYVFGLVRYRVVGAMGEAFAGNAMREPVTQLSQLDPVRFVSSLGLWIGLAFAVAFLAAAIWLRRGREPN
jgi:ABC-2 type transport system permease protein